MMTSPNQFQRGLNTALKFAFKLLYHEMAWTYDGVAAAVSLGRWKSWVYTCLDYLPGPRVLEVGHGPGHLQSALYQPGMLCIGIDKSRQMGRIAQRNLLEAGLRPNLVNCYAQSLPLASGFFDQVVSTFPSEYIFSLQTLNEIKRVLSPGGRLVIVPLAWITGRSLPDRLAAWLFHVTGQTPPASLAAVGPQLEKLLEQAGFQTSSHYLECRDSQVLVVLGEKPFQRST